MMGRKPHITDGVLYGLARAALLAGSLMPALVYILIGYSGMRQTANEDARIQALRVGYAIAANSGIWQYTTERLIDQIEEIRHARSHSRLTDSNGNTLTEIGQACSGYCIAGNAPILDFGKAAGNLRVESDATPILVRGGLIGAGGLIIGLLLMWILNRTLSERRRIEESMRLTRFSIDAASDAIFWIAPDARIVDVNTAACASLGYSRGELLKLSVPDVDANVNAEVWLRHIAEVRQRGTLTLESTHRTKDGRLIPVEIVANHIELGNKEFNCAFVRDISERKRTENLLRESEQHFRTLANGGSTLIWTSGLDKRCDYFNEPWLRFTGRSLEQEVGDGWIEGVHPDDLSHCLQTYVAAFDQRRSFSMDYRLRHGDGSYRWIRDDGNPRYDSRGEFIGYIGFCMDITEQKAAEEQIKNLAYFDFLTGLPNRLLLLDRLEQALAASSRHHREGALLFLDLDDFKVVNDTYGHDVGDRLLREAGRRLETCVRQGDTVARLGGDEFVVMLEYLDENHELAVGQARVVGEKILAELGLAYLLDGHHCVSPPSVGITLFKGQEKTSSELLRQADLAMYQAKQDGRKALSFYHAEMRGVPQQ
ncbi:MAG: sensor domain-containing diguanylate cyclase [Rhodocyclaceae bacterium]|nr:MAG: sensor domain-containing diguanylate cyclase [Rhodocyclaceae bacterium]